jgi:hypothetical protein
VSSPLDLLNKFIGAVIAYGPKNKTKKAIKAARRKTIAARKLAKVSIREKQQMTRQIERHHLHKLRNKALLYVYEHVAGQPKGMVPLTDLKTALKITNNEWRSLYLLFKEEGLGDTDGMNANMLAVIRRPSEAQHRLVYCS